MTAPRYTGVALGGPQAGEILTHFKPQWTYTPPARMIGLEPLQSSVYYFVPFMGLRGAWLHESETKGTQAWDDIMRVLVENYFNTLQAARRAQI